MQDELAKLAVAVSNDAQIVEESAKQIHKPTKYPKPQIPLEKEL